MTKPTPETMIRVESLLPTAFHVHTADVQWNLQSQALVQYSLAYCAGVPVMYALPGQRQRLSLWGAIPALQESEFVRALPATAVGGDEFHFLPGVPLDNAPGERLRGALEAAGFKGNEVCDLAVELAHPAVETLIAEARSSHAANVTEARDIAAWNELSGFLAKEFPGRWHREFQFWQSREDTRAAWWLTLKEAGEVLGFARVARQPQKSGAWRPGALRLGQGECDSCLGPIGVAKAQRGRGTGRNMLALALASLKERGGARVCIDWTDALKFYAPLKYKILRRYWMATR